MKYFVYNNYSLGGSERMYFSEENAARIDFIRTKIEDWYKSERIDSKEYYYLIACLLESVSKVANVAGVYGAYLKKWDPRAVKPMNFIEVEMEKSVSKFDNEVYNEKIEELINELKKDYTIIIVTHNMQQATRVSDYTAFFMLGEVIECDKTIDLFSQPKNKKTEDYITGRFG